MATPDSNTGKSSKRKGEQWAVCDRCGRILPYSELTIQQGETGGPVVCLQLCLDEPCVGDYERAMEKPVERPLDFVFDA